MGKAFDPKMLQQMGGMGNIMNMVKEMGNMEGMQDMMQQMMGGAGGAGLPGMPAGMNLNALAGMMEHQQTRQSCILTTQLESFLNLIYHL